MEGLIVDNRTPTALVQIQDRPRSPCRCFEQITKKEVAITADDMERIPEELTVREPDIWFGTLSPGQTRHEYLTGEPVFSQGEPADAVYYVESGKVQLTTRSEDGEQAVTSAFDAGSFLGEACLADQAVRSTSASALMGSTIVRIEKQPMMELFRSDPEFAVRFLTSLVSRSICMEEELVSQILDSGEALVARTGPIED